MAKAKKEQELPAGFQPVSSKLDGWYVVKTGNAIQGYLRDIFTVKSKFGPKRVYKVEISKGKTECVSATEGEFEAEEGAMIGVDEKGWLKSLATIPANTEIYIRCLGQEDAKQVKKGQSPAWKFLVGAVSRDKSSDDSDDVPF